MTEKTIIDITGWAGSVCVLTAYGLLSMHKLNSHSRLYQFLNVFGSICLIVNTFFYSAYPSTFVNIVWLIIAIFAIISILRSKNNAKKPSG
ncbi:MAG: hypothetical protein IT281_06825 [Ignavibacteria bacterium]|nr:hypothetical protein [Ignavibacteria bacterium]MCC7159233.1 hypothetical protein [Ignavibacteria bacterium]